MDWACVAGELLKPNTSLSAGPPNTTSAVITHEPPLPVRVCWLRSYRQCLSICVCLLPVACLYICLCLPVCVPSAERNVHLSVCEGFCVALRVLGGCIG